jgi:predicted nucleic-acid-binding protein
MIGFDTNVLVRLIVSDDPEQTVKVRRYIEDNCSDLVPGFISNVVLAETVWVLESTYGLNRSDIARALENILAATRFVVQDLAQVQAALDTFKKTSIGFTDLLILSINRANGCDTTATFDRKAAKLEGFTLVR